jgi:hypothetical protein
MGMSNRTLQQERAVYTCPLGSIGFANGGAVGGGVDGILAFGVENLLAGHVGRGKDREKRTWAYLGLFI